MTKVVVANPGADVYGSDLQVLESVCALVDAGVPVTVAVPATGPLVAQLVAAGAAVEVVDFPVLRRTDQSIAGLVRLLGGVLTALPRMVGLLRRSGADVVYVNTVTIPWWMLAGRIARTKVVCHVHEAEGHDRLMARLALYLPLVLAHRLVMISRAAERAAVSTVGPLARRSTLIRNGVPDRPTPSVARPRGGVTRVGVVARLSPRKGTMDAVEAVAAARRSGIDCELHLFGSVFPGYEWYEDELRTRATAPDLAGYVVFHGYTRPVWPAFDSLDVVLAPSHVEPFGNSVVEAQLSCRPVIASRAEGHLESIVDGESGVLVDIGDVDAMAAALGALVAEPERAERLGEAARSRALDRNGIGAYRDAIVRVIEEPAA